MRVSVTLKMPRGSIIRGEGEHNPFTGEIIFSAKTASEVELRLHRSISELRHIIEAIVLINGIKKYLKYKENRWMVVKQVANNKKQAEKWEVPPPAPRCEIPIHRSRSKEPVHLRQESGKKVRTVEFYGMLKQYFEI